MSWYVLVRRVAVSSTAGARLDQLPIRSQNNMHRGLYSSPQAVAYDLFLIWSNAREYNEQGSLVYADADKLEVSRPHRLAGGRCRRSWRDLFR